MKTKQLVLNTDLNVVTLGDLCNEFKGIIIALSNDVPIGYIIKNDSSWIFCNELNFETCYGVYNTISDVVSTIQHNYERVNFEVIAFR